MRASKITADTYSGFSSSKGISKLLFKTSREIDRVDGLRTIVVSKDDLALKTETKYKLKPERAFNSK